VNADRIFVASQESVGQSRRFVADAIGDLPREVRDQIVLMVSELATNALVHAAGGFRMTIDRTADDLRVAVADQGGAGGREGPQVRSPRSDEPHGRGLRIVDKLADEWGTAEVPFGVGQVVWFRVGLDDRRPRQEQPTLNQEQPTLA
jgi:anti-sigma regulatory factor (Ser/Thr protein kinase)